MVHQLLLAALIATASALSINHQKSAQELFTIELAPGQSLVVTEAEKWALKAEGKNFFGITDSQYKLSTSSLNTIPIKSVKPHTYPETLQHTPAIKALLSSISKPNLQETLEYFSSFHTRFYKSTHGQHSSEWLLKQINDIIAASPAGATNGNITAQALAHGWSQSSIIARIPGQALYPTIITGQAPGADDNGTGSMTILEAFRVLLSSPLVDTRNAIEFHWYSGEEAGLLGSQDIFNAYMQEGRDVAAMLSIDMTGYVKKGTKEVIGVIGDYVNAELTDFTKKIIDAHCDIPWEVTYCRYACSDHASAGRVGYQTAFVTESTFENVNPHTHTTKDTIDIVNFDHVVQYVKLVTALTYELAHHEG